MKQQTMTTIQFGDAACTRRVAAYPSIPSDGTCYPLDALGGVNPAPPLSPPVIVAATCDPASVLKMPSSVARAQARTTRTK